MNVVGLDLSLAATGIATVIGTCTVTTDADDQIEMRLQRIVSEVMGTVEGATLVVIEDFVTRSPGASLLGMVHGAVRFALSSWRTQTALVPPAALKKYATGKGNATKADMRMALYQRAGIDLRDDNQVDAWWLRHMGLDHLGRPLFELPKAQRAMLDKITWPTIEAT